MYVRRIIFLALFFLERGLSVKSFVIGSILFVISAPVAVWTIGGLEQPLVVFLLTLAVILVDLGMRAENFHFGKLLVAYMLFGLITITRPDGLVFPAVTSVVLCCIALQRRSGITLWKVLLVSLIPMFFAAGQVFFRVFYYGEWLPNTAFIKLRPSFHHFYYGVLYVLKGLVTFSPILILVLYWMVKHRKMLLQPLFATILASTVVWLLYVAIIGGDISPAYRHLVVLIPFLTLILLYVWETIDWVGIKTYLFTCLLLLSLAFQFMDFHNYRAVLERWEFHNRSFGKKFNKTFGQNQPLVAVSSAGALPFWLKTPCIDILGLCDYHIARNPPKTLGNGILGHEFADGHYVMQRQPDALIFGAGSYDIPGLTGIQLRESSVFTEHYIPVCFRNRKRLFWAHINKDSPKIGAFIDGSVLIVPSYLFAQKNYLALNDFKNEKVISTVSPFDSVWFYTELDSVKHLNLLTTDDNKAIAKMRFDHKLGKMTITNKSKDSLRFTSAEIILK